MACNPPAFPSPETRNDEGSVWKYAEDGMSLRDYFAAAALQAYVSQYGATVSHSDSAKAAYLYADAMLAAREGK